MPLRAASRPPHTLVLCLRLLPPLARLTSPAPTSSQPGQNRQLLGRGNVLKKGRGCIQIIWEFC